MIAIDEVGEMLDELATTLPQEFYHKLNGGILLLPEAKKHPEGKKSDLYILGQYHYDRNLGRYIIIYYGSMIQVFGYLSKEGFYQELERVLIHEFTHHIESLAGECQLEQKDKKQLQEYKQKFNKKEGM